MSGRKPLACTISRLGTEGEMSIRRVSPRLVSMPAAREAARAAIARQELAKGATATDQDMTKSVSAIRKQVARAGVGIATRSSVAVETAKAVTVAKPGRSGEVITLGERTGRKMGLPGVAAMCPPSAARVVGKDTDASAGGATRTDVSSNVSSVIGITKELSTLRIGGSKSVTGTSKATAAAASFPPSSGSLRHDSNNNFGKSSKAQHSATKSAALTNGSIDANLVDAPRSRPPQSIRKSMVMANSALLRNFDADHCKFCFLPLKAGEGIMIQECLHVFCRDCIQSAIELQQEECRIPCPVADEDKCEGFLTDLEVKELVRPEVFQEYLDRSLVIAKKKMKNVFNCKTEGCVAWCEFDEGRKTFDCPKCSKTNCMECNAIHTGVDCATYKTLLQSGQLSKVEELMEKERKNGWMQLTAIVNASSGDAGQGIDTDLLWNNMEFDCSICFSDVAPGQGIILHECLHMFCKDCLINLVEHNDEPTVKCPYIDENYSCVCQMQPREIKALVPKAIYEKHLQRSVKLGESSMANSFHCKTPDCPGWCEFEEGVKSFKCPRCNKVNCILCQALHTGSCEDYKNRLVQNKNDKLSTDAVEKLVKTGEYMRCPKCKIPVHKTAGCDWIMCPACRTEICWVTRGPRWGPRGHGDTSGGCRCRVNGKKCHPKCGNCH